MGFTTYQVVQDVFHQQYGYVAFSSGHAQWLRCMMLAGVTWWQIAQSWLTWWPRKTRAIWLRLRPSWVPNTHNIHPSKIQMEHTKMEVCFTFFLLKHIFLIGWFFRFHLNFQGGITPNFQLESEIWSIFHGFLHVFSPFGSTETAVSLGPFRRWQSCRRSTCFQWYKFDRSIRRCQSFLGSEAYPNFPHN